MPHPISINVEEFALINLCVNTANFINGQKSDKLLYNKKTTFFFRYKGFFMLYVYTYG